MIAINEETQLENMFKDHDEYREEDKNLDDELEAIFDGSIDYDFEEDNYFDVTAEKDKTEDNESFGR